VIGCKIMFPGENDCFDADGAEKEKNNKIRKAIVGFFVRKFKKSIVYNLGDFF